MKEQPNFISVIIVSLFVLVAAHAVTPQPDEFSLRNEWMNPLFGRTEQVARPHLEILYEDVSDGVSRGRSWRGTPYQLGGKTYTNGLGFNSTKHLLVVLGQPAERFVADVGLENNDDTQRGAATGHGSVTFHVLVDSTEVYASPVLRLKDGACAINVPLNGARQFEIRVKDGGDGRSWDQALWAGAVVKLQDGTSVTLQDLPLGETAPKLSLTMPPFSFLYDGKPSAEVLKSWQARHDTQKLDSHRTEHTLVYTDPASSLEVRCVLVEYHDFPTVEWTLYFKNTGSTDTPILEKIQALDIELTAAAMGEFLLHHNVGSPANGNDYGPLETALGRGATKRLGGAGGRPTNADWSYFNLEWSGEGTHCRRWLAGTVGGRVCTRRRDAACTCVPARN